MWKSGWNINKTFVELNFCINIIDSTKIMCNWTNVKKLVFKS